MAAVTVPACYTLALSTMNRPAVGVDHPFLDLRLPGQAMMMIAFATLEF